MRELQELKEVYPTIFDSWMTDHDIIMELDRLHTSREYCYLNRKGFGVYDINDDVEVIDGKCEGYYHQELTWNGSKSIKVILEIYLEDWDEEEKMYLSESAKVVGWEYE